MMVEVPSNVIILDKFIDVGIDGISIGSNDLTQLVLGIDRDSEALADTFDERNDAVMAAIENAVTVARRRGITASICGQAPSVYPEVTEKLVEWGITSVSVSPDMIDRTREIIATAEAKLGRAPKARDRLRRARCSLAWPTRHFLSRQALTLTAWTLTRCGAASKPTKNGSALTRRAQPEPQARRGDAFAIARCVSARS